MFNAFLKEYFHSTQYTVYPLAGDASTRKYFRVTAQPEGSEEERSWVLMQWEPFQPDTYPFLSVLEHFKKHLIHVPEVIQVSPKEGLILLEDLGDLTLERRFWETQSQDGSLAFYKLAIDELLKIHFPASLDSTSNCVALKIKFDLDKFLWELNYARENLLVGVLNFKFTDKTNTALQKIFTSICKRLDAEPKCIQHRDYHSRNVMIKYNKMRVIDFQDARLGPVQYDLVSLLKDSYVNLNDESSTELIEYYLANAKAEYPTEYSKLGSPEHFQLIYELQSIQRCFKACGSFSSFYVQREDRRYLKYIEGTLQRVIKSLGFFPEYKLFLDLLIDSGALTKEYESL